MKNKSEIIALFLIICIVICSVPVSAESHPKIYVTSANAAPGSTFTLEVKVSDNPGFCSFRFGINYDRDVLTLQNVELAEGLSGQFLYLKKAVWLGDSDTYMSGTLLTLTFSVSDSAGYCDSPVSLTFSHGDICNYSEQPVLFEQSGGTVSVRPAVAFGDINSDGKINAVDSNILTRIIIGDTIPDSDYIKFADLNFDGKINGVDKNILKTKILGNDFTTDVG